MARPLVLLVEDDEWQAHLIELALQQIDPSVRVELIEDDDRALHRLLAEPQAAAECSVPPCLVLVDLQHPRQDGRDLLQALREQPRRLPCPVLLLDAAAPDGNGCRSHLQEQVRSKPDSFGGLIDLLRPYLRPARQVA